jgi:hypothetical protein
MAKIPAKLPQKPVKQYTKRSMKLTVKPPAKPTQKTVSGIKTKHNVVPTLSDTTQIKPIISVPQGSQDK